MLSSAQKTKCVLFDWDGTLVDNTRLIYEITNSLLAKHGYKKVSYPFFRQTASEATIEGHLRNLGMTDGRHMELFSSDFSPLYKASMGRIRLHRQAKSLLKELKAMRLPVAILSNCPQDDLDILVGRKFPAGHFNHVIGRSPETTKLCKADRAKALLSTIGVTAEETILVGDGIPDAEVAQNLGLRCLLFSKGMPHPSVLEKVGFPIIHNLNETLEHVG